MSSNLPTLLDNIADALEAITPDLRANVLFKRWTGEGLVEQAPIEIRERKFQIRLGPTLSARTISSLTQQWHRAEVHLYIGYNLTEPRQNDSSSSNLGIHLLPWVDQKQILNKLQMSNVFSASTGVKRLLFLGADEPSETARRFRFDLEWSESF